MNVIDVRDSLLGLGMTGFDYFDHQLRRLAILFYLFGAALVIVCVNVQPRGPGLRPVAADITAACGVLGALLIAWFPWQRFHRNSFIVMSLASVLLVAIDVYFTGGATSPFAVFYLLAVVFGSFYYPRPISLVLGIVVAALNLLPFTYSSVPANVELNLVASSAALLLVAWAGGVMAEEIVRRAGAYTELQADFAEAAELRDELARATELERRRVAGLLALQRTGAVVYSSREQRSAIHSMLTELVDSLGYRYVSIYVADGDCLVMVDQLGYAAPIERFPLGRGIMSSAYATKQAILLPDVSQDPRYVAADDGIRSEMCVPLRLDGQVVGVINVETTDEPLDVLDLELLELFAQQASGALGSACAHEQQELEARDALSASRLLSRLKEDLGLEDTFRAAVEGPVEDCDGISAACLWLLEGAQGTQTWRCAAFAGSLSPGSRPPDAFLNAVEDGTAHVLSYGELRALPDVSSPLWHGGVEVMVLPLLRGTELLGVHAVYAAMPLREEQRVYLTTFVTHVALLIENARAALREQRRTAQLEAIHAISREIVSVLDPDMVCEKLVQVVARQLDYTIVTLFLCEESSDLRLAAHVGLRSLREGVPPDQIKLARGVGIVGHVAETGAPYFTGDVRADPHYEHLGHTYIRSEVAMPIKSGQELLGVLNIESERLNGFDEMDITALEAVANQASVALQNARAHAQLAQQATTDMLTGVYNRRGLIERLDSELSRAHRFCHDLSVLFFDLDHFKAVNDTFGHHTGDLVLQQLAQVARRTLRDIDLVGRYGGEEFVAILPEADRKAGLIAAERLREAVARHDFELPDGASIRLTVSIGVATAPEDGTRRDQLLRTADDGLYRAKHNGRNQVARAVDDPPAIRELTLPYNNGQQG